MRALHFGACLVLFGALAFGCITGLRTLADGAQDLAEYWHRCVMRLTVVTLPLVLFSGAGWFLLVGMDLSGQSLGEFVRSDAFGIFARQTAQGILWQWRLGIWLAAAILFLTARRARPVPRWREWLLLVVGGLLLASLAWGGHGREGHPARWHLAADALHLLAAGIWPTGLLPLFLVLRKLHGQSDPAALGKAQLLVRRFSALSLTVVLTLALTGVINTCFLVGSLAQLITESYGRWLLAKLLLFAAAAALGAVNLLKHKPSLTAESKWTGRGELRVRRLQSTVLIELWLSLGVVCVVAVLGVLPPAVR